MANITLGQNNQISSYTRTNPNGVNNTIVDFGSIYFKANLNGAQESPPVNTTASGQGTFTLSKDQDELTLAVSVQNIDLDGNRTPASGDDVHGIHFHQAPAGVNGGIVWGVLGPDSDTDNDTVFNGPANSFRSVWDGNEGNGTTLGAQVDNLLDNLVYLNIHSEDFGGGEIRGQLIKQDNGADRVGVAGVNIGEFSTLLQVMTDIGGNATLSTRLNGEVYRLTLQGLSESDLDAGDFIFAGSVNQTINGTDNGDDLFGAGGNDTLNLENGNDRGFGESGNDVLDGGLGKDTLIGGLGNDVYIVDAITDVVTEEANGGTDSVRSTVTRTLGANFEDLILQGTNAINGAGNAANNKLTGNSAANVLNGGLGNDTMSGVEGNDTYLVSSAGDVVSESRGTGIDKVQSSVSFTLGTGLENLTLAGAAAINGTGNGLGNSLLGNAAANRLNGLAGDDTLSAGGGADRFVFTTALNEATNVDRIVGYSVAADTIEIDNAVFSGLAGGVLIGGAFRIGAAAQDGNDRIIYNSAAGRLLFDSDGVGGAAAKQFATIGAGLALTNADFFVV